MRNVTKANKKVTLEKIRDPVQRKIILDNFDRGIFTVGSDEVREAQLHTWLEFHEAWFGDTVSPFPLTIEKIRCVSACFKDAGYRSYPNYLTRAKDQHLEDGFLWSDALDRMARRATRSVRRGIGPPCGAAPLDLHTFPAQLVDNPAAKFTPPDDPGLPVNVLALVIMASLFMLREIEVAALRVKDVVVNTASCTVTLFLAVSKTDPTARGCYRSWGLPLRA